MASTNNHPLKRIIFPPTATLYLWIPLSVGVVLRVYGISSNSIWYDESLTIFLTRQPLMNMVSLLTAELNPPLWEILEWFVIRVFMPSEISFRLLSLISGISTLIVAHKLLSFFQVDFLRQFLVMSILSLSPYQIWLAQDARIYGLMSLVYLLGFWFIIQQKWLGMFACFGLILYSNSAGVFFFLSLIIIALCLYPEKWRMILLISCGAVSLFIPWLISSFGNNLSGNYFAGYNIPPVNAQRVLEQLNNIFLAASTSNSPLPGLLWIINLFILIFFFAFVGLFPVFLILRRKINPNSTIRTNLSVLLTLIFLPLGMIILTALVYDNGHLILYRSFSPLSVPLILLISEFSKFKSKFASAVLIIFLLINLSYHSAWSVQEKGGYLKETLQNLSIPNQPSTIIFHATANSLLPFSYYLNNATHYLLEADLPAGFLIEPLQQTFGLMKISPEQIPSTSCWIIWADDAHLPPFVTESMNNLTKHSLLMGKIAYPQAATIYIYRANP